MRIQFLWATQTVTGSKYLIQTEQKFQSTCNLPEYLNSDSRRARKVRLQGDWPKSFSQTFESHGWLSRAPGWLHACLRKAFRPITLLAQSFFGGNGWYLNKIDLS